VSAPVSSKKKKKKSVPSKMMQQLGRQLSIMQSGQEQPPQAIALQSSQEQQRVRTEQEASYETIFVTNQLMSRVAMLQSSQQQ
jgi:hypothetical protein